MTLSSVASWGLYFTAVTGGGVHESTQPAPSSIISESANLLGLILPINIAENGGTELPSVMERIRLLSTPTTSAPFDDTWFWVMVTASAFLESPGLYLVLSVFGKRKVTLLHDI